MVLDFGLVLPRPRQDEEPRESLVLFPENGHHLGKPQMGGELVSGVCGDLKENIQLLDRLEIGTETTASNGQHPLF